MAGYVGADGIRGKVSESLTVYKVFLTGRFIGALFRDAGSGKIVLGKDTRLSSDVLESAFAAGAAAQGCDVYLTGVVPTPVIAWLSGTQDFSGGAVITGSHNPFSDNGILLFNGEGKPIGEDEEQKLESYIGGFSSINYADSESIGRIYPYPEGLDLYCDWLKNRIDLDLSGIRILADLANGAAISTCARVLSSLGAEVVTRNDAPDGFNINRNCGTFFPEAIRDEVVQNGYDYGLVFDGSADRIVMMLKDGRILDGDQMLYLILTAFHSLGKEGYDRTALTVVSNSGTVKSLEKRGISVRICRAGIRSLINRMEEEQLIAGAENNGHIVLREFTMMPDSLVAALVVIKAERDSGKTAAELLEGLELKPYLFESIRVIMKSSVIEDAEVQETVSQVLEQFGEHGRVILRAAVTEPVVRVLCEATDYDVCRQGMERICEVISRRFGIGDDL